MLFLLNDMIVEIDQPELHLQTVWRSMGCPDPRGMRAQDAVEFVQKKLAGGYPLNADEARNFAALIVAKTGANSLIFKPTASGTLEPRLRHVPTLVLDTYRRGAANEGGETRYLISA
ncbi:MAG: hypothetical protein QNI84_15965 [Henriciella sp.]|nr:hypothetical protein [Henriciella sp.]